MLTEEVQVTCPCCWEPLWLLVDLSAGDQEYVEDCSVCCRPMTVRVAIRDGRALLEVAPEG